MVPDEKAPWSSQEARLQDEFQKQPHDFSKFEQQQVRKAAKETDHDYFEFGVK